MKDRLQDLSHTRRALSFRKSEARVTFSVESSSEQSKAFDAFFEEVEDVRGDIKKIEGELEEVKKDHSRLLSSPTLDAKVTKDLEERLTRIRSLASAVKSKLRAMKKVNELEQKDKPNSCYFRIRETQHSVLQKIFVDAMTDFYRSQSDYKVACREKLRRQMEIMGKETSEAEIEELLEAGNVRVFTQGINFANSVDGLRMLADIETRHNQLVALEKTLRELHALFLELSVLVERQGEMVDSIERHVSRAKEATEVATRQLDRALKYRRKGLRRKIAIAAVLSAIIVIIIIVSVV